MNETGKAHLLSSAHAFADPFIDQLVEGARLLALRDQRRPGEGLQFVACDGRRGRSAEHQRGRAGVVEEHRPRGLRQAIETARLELIDFLEEQPHCLNRITSLVGRNGRSGHLCPVFACCLPLRARWREHGEERRLVQREGADQCGILQRGDHCPGGAAGPADKMNRSHIERRDEPGKIVDVGRDTEVLSVVGPWVGPVITLGIGNEPIPLGDLVPRGLPNAKVGKCSMEEDDGLPGAILDIGQANTVDFDFLDRRRGHRGGRDQKAKHQRCNCIQALGFHDNAPSDAC
jgi:hypothetical protein